MIIFLASRVVFAFLKYIEAVIIIKQIKRTKIAHRCCLDVLKTIETLSIRKNSKEKAYDYRLFIHIYIVNILLSLIF